jgi:hypothetical protein
MEAGINMSNNERKMVIKDCLFEGVMMGQDLRAVISHLHLEDGFTKEEIVEALKEMREEAEQ